jgi:hypothetical protein
MRTSGFVILDSQSVLNLHARHLNNYTTVSSWLETNAFSQNLLPLRIPCAAHHLLSYPATAADKLYHNNPTQQ